MVLTPPHTHTPHPPPHLTPYPPSPPPHTYPRYQALVWGKVVLAASVLRLGYSVHVSDVDVVSGLVRERGHDRVLWEMRRHNVDEQPKLQSSCRTTAMALLRVRSLGVPGVGCCQGYTGLTPWHLNPQAYFGPVLASYRELSLI